MDMALPALLPEREEAPPCVLQELLAPPVLNMPRPFSNRSTKTSCSTLGAPGATPAARELPQAEGADAAEGSEGYSWDDWPWLSQGASGVDGRYGCFGPEEAFAAGDKKSRVRDVWSPVSGAAGVLEVRPTLPSGGVVVIPFAFFLLSSTDVTEAQSSMHGCLRV